MLYDGAVTLEDDGGALTGELTLDSEMVVGSTVTTVINGHTFIGTVEEQGGGLMVGVWLDDPEFTLVTRLGNTSITVPSDVAEVGEVTVEIVQSED